MLTQATNIHRSLLPPAGSLVTVRGLESHGFNPKRKAIVESYPLTDAADPRYSKGIHTCTIRFLDNGERRRVSGHWCWEVDWAGFPVSGNVERGDYQSWHDVYRKREPRKEEAEPLKKAA